MKKLVALLVVACALIPIGVSAAVSPASAKINNASPGGSYHMTLTIRNDSQETKDYACYYKIAGYPDVNEAGKTGIAQGYTNIGNQAQDWVTIGKGVNAGQEYIATCGSGRMVEVPVDIVIPADAKLPDRWVFWIATANQDGNIITENCSTILVDMRQVNMLPWIVGGIVGIGIICGLFLLRGKNKN